MSYDYNTERKYVFTEEGVRKLLVVRDAARAAIAAAGAVQAGVLIAAVSGDSWQSMALIDYLEEIGELRCIKKDCAGQHRIYVRPGA